MYPSFPPATKFHEICLGGDFLRDLADSQTNSTYHKPPPRLFALADEQYAEHMGMHVPLYKYGVQMCIQTNRVPCLHLASTQNNELTASVQAEHMD